jgi:tRNA(adenine34) deaminase
MSAPLHGATGARLACGCAMHSAVPVPSRRAVMTSLVSALVIPVVTLSLPNRARADAAEDERFMRIALEEARRGDFPFGAVIVREGREVARGRNLGLITDDPTAHGEMIAIRRALAVNNRTLLVGSTLYTTGEPCAMCMGAILWCHFGRLVFAASIEQLLTRIDQIMISSAELARRAPFAPIEITGGVLAEEAMALFPPRQ